MVLQCDKCLDIYKHEVFFSKASREKHANRRHFCPVCVLKRRDPEDFKRIYGYLLPLDDDQLQLALEKLERFRGSVDNI